MDDEEVTPRSGELPTANYGWLKPTVGNTDDAWGSMLNADLDGIDSVVAAKLSDAPSDTNTYGRKGGAWSIITGASVTVSDTAPSSPSAGALWWDSVGGQMYIFYTDPNTSQWVPVSNQLGGGYLLKQGVTDGSNAPAGQIGEVISSVVPQASGVPLTTGIDTQITSILLTAGDWDISGETWITPTVSCAAAYGGINNTVLIPGTPGVGYSLGWISVSGITGADISLRTCRASLTAITTYYLIGTAYFSSGTCKAAGVIMARRVR